MKGSPRVAQGAMLSVTLALATSGDAVAYVQAKAHLSAGIVPRERYVLEADFRERTTALVEKLFAHASLRPGQPLAEQDEYDLLWIREPFLEVPCTSGIVVVHRHTPETEPVLRSWRFGVDTSLFATGRLTAARTDAGGRISFIASRTANPLAAPMAPETD